MTDPQQLPAPGRVAARHSAAAGAAAASGVHDGGAASTGKASGTVRGEQEECMAAFRDTGDEAAFHALVRGHVGAMRAFARRFVGCSFAADDLVQEALIRAFQHLGTLRGVGSLRSWLFRIVVRLGSEPQRWTRREPSRGEAAHERVRELPAGVGDDPVRPSIERELQDRLAEAMERLPARQRAALHLRAAEGLDYRGIADAMECSVGAARMLVHAARQQLLERMGEHLEP